MTAARVGPGPVMLRGERDPATQVETILGVASATRNALAPELPTMVESGLPGYEVVGWNAIHVPKGTSPAVIGKINADTLKVVRLPDVRERMFGMGFEASESTVQEFDAFTRRDVARWTKVIKEARITPE